MRAPKKIDHFDQQGVRWDPPSRNWLVDQFLVKDKSATRIAAEIGAHLHTVLGWIHKHEISTGYGTGGKS